MSDAPTQAAPKRTTRVPGQAAAPAAPEATVVDDGLPNSVDVDPAKITGPTLTRQGWVVPVRKG